VVAGLLLTLGAVAARAELGPTKPSQLVTIISGSTGCGLSGTGKAIDGVGNGGALLAIPKKEVLVITDIEVLQFGLDPGGTGFVAFDLEPENRNYFSMFVTAGPTGNAYGQRTFQNGIVVKPGTTICSFQDNASWTLHGYFTKDK
jgi:hypothetical protein